MTEEKHFLDELPAYALGAVDQAEALQIEAHLSTCASCRAELKSYQQVVEKLPLAVALSAPRADLKNELMEQVARNTAQKGHETIKSPATTTGWRNRLSGFFSTKDLTFRLAGLAVLLLLAISNLNMWQRVKQLERPAGFQVVQLTGTTNAQDARGVLVISEEGMEGTLVVEHLPILDPDHQYQLWLIEDGKRISGGVFSAGESGYGRLVVTSPGSLLLYDSFGVTIEPAGGSPGPTGKKVLGGNL